MSRTKPAALAFAVILVLLACPSPAAVASNEDESARDSEEVRIEVEIEINDEEDDDDDHGPAFLDVTLRLEFRLTPEEPEARPLMVVCSGGEYEVRNTARGPDFEHSLHIAGELFGTDHLDRFRLTFEAVSEHRERRNFEGVSGRRGSAILTLGSDTTLANLGEQTLVVTATLVNDKDGGLTHVVTSDAEYYVGGPQQARPPDGTFRAGTMVSIVEEAGSYTLVRSKNGITAYIAADVLRPLTRE